MFFPFHAQTHLCSPHPPRRLFSARIMQAPDAVVPVVAAVVRDTGSRVWKLAELGCSRTRRDCRVRSLLLLLLPPPFLLYRFPLEMAPALSCACAKDFFLVAFLHRSLFASFFCGSLGRSSRLHLGPPPPPPLPPL
jgi:hypothetical protein